MFPKANAGDTADATIQRAVLTFELGAGIPANSIIEKANINLRLSGGSGDPFRLLGGLAVSRVEFDALGIGACTGSAVKELVQTVTQEPTGGKLTLAVPSIVGNTDARQRLQFCAYFKNGSNSNNAEDMVQIDLETTSFDVTYVSPADP